MIGASPRLVPALPVNQWLPGWDKIEFDAGEHRAKPGKTFYLFSLPARELRSLSGIFRRSAKNAAARTDDLGIQRQHDPERSEEITRFVEFGYPWSTLGRAKRSTAEFNDLRKPGWLPTALVINILVDGTERNGNTIENDDVVRIVDVDGQKKLQLPYEKWTADWSAKSLPPFEVIDGQHRLWAFDDAAHLDGFELPVVAFVGLDISWQAYLFWTINIKPKRINASLAFDLYPLLRNEDWLDRAEGHSIYRETRAQELTEVLWSYPDSAWYDRINMLGEKGSDWVTQSAWIKSLTATLIRPWDKNRSGSTGGLFGGRSKNLNEVLGWSRGQQAAFLIFAWNALKKSVAAYNVGWAANLRDQARPEPQFNLELGTPRPNEDPAFYGSYTLINTDQGVRGYLYILNDLCYQAAPKLRLNTWLPKSQSSVSPIESVKEALETLLNQQFVSFVQAAADSLAQFDWRTSSTPGLSDADRRAKLVFRGSSGYREIRAQLLEHLATANNEDIADAAKRLIGTP